MAGPFTLLRELWRIFFIAKLLLETNTLISVLEQLPVISTNFTDLLWQHRKKKLLIQPYNIKWRRDWSSEVMERSLVVWGTVILRCFIFCDQEFDVKSFQPTIKYGSYCAMFRGKFFEQRKLDVVECEGNKF